MLFLVCWVFNYTFVPYTGREVEIKPKKKYCQRDERYYIGLSLLTYMVKPYTNIFYTHLPIYLKFWLFSWVKELRNFGKVWALNGASMRDETTFFKFSAHFSDIIPPQNIRMLTLSNNLVFFAGDEHSKYNWWKNIRLLCWLTIKPSKIFERIGLKKAVNIFSIFQFVWFDSYLNWMAVSKKKNATWMYTYKTDTYKPLSKFE